MEDYYRICAFISEKALQENFCRIRERVGGETPVIAVIKADAYGHGALNVARVLARAGADAFAVATVREAVELRLKGLRLPMMILGHTDSSEFPLILEFGIEATVFTFEEAKALSEMAVENDMKATVHLKLDTGMSRIGLPANEEGLAEAVRIASLPGINVKGIFTHFARADEADKRYAEAQFAQFERFCDALAERGVEIPLRHAGNSAAIMEFPEAYRQPEDKRFTRGVRPGIMLYGLYPSDEMDRDAFPLSPVMSVKTHIAFVKTVPAGTPVSYGGTYITERESRIATIPVGYADGYPRHMSNKGWVIIAGKKAPIRGRVCMDQFMVDVTDIPEAEYGSEATLLGEGISADEIAAICDTIHYEIVCQLTARVPREMSE